MAHNDGDSPSRDPAIAALDLILELTVVLNADMTQRLARDGLTVSRTQLLWELHHRGPSPQRRLAGTLAVSPRTVTGLVDGLAATGFVTREPHPTDRRATLVTLTARGTAVMADLARDQREFATLLFAGMPGDRLDCVLAGLSDVLTRLREHGVGHPTTGDDNEDPDGTR